MKYLFRILILFLLFLSTASFASEETLPPLTDGSVPQTLEELWADFDPRAEPLDVEILHEWEEDNVVMKVLRLRIGIFKGKKAMLAGVYGFPKGARNLPGLLQIHGGGQYADYRAVLTNAKRGYATISISWAGRIATPDYKVNPTIVQLFFADAKGDPEYKLTTDWGALDGYHAPYRYVETNSTMDVDPTPWTLDAVDSPRNCSYFLWTLAARRALTFLEQQPEVNGGRLGVYGHSMGATITVLTAGSDDRIKVAVPSCGGVSGGSSDVLAQETLADALYLDRISCPIMFLNPSNDFHGHLIDVPEATKLINTDEWRVVSSPHGSHQDLGEFEVGGLLWLDQHLKGNFVLPEPPESSMILESEYGVPVFKVTPNPSKQILSVNIYYTQQGSVEGEEYSREDRKSRFWHTAKASEKDGTWTAILPLGSVDKPLWAYANVRYGMDESVEGAGYYYKVYATKNFNLSTPVQVATSDELIAAGVRATLKHSLIIDTFEDDWKTDWFTYKEEGWDIRTHKIHSDLWKAPIDAKLLLELRSEEPNSIAIGADGFATELSLPGGNVWKKFIVSPSDFQSMEEGETFTQWSEIRELSLGARESLRKRVNDELVTKEFGGEWTGPDPEFRMMRWVLEE